MNYKIAIFDMDGTILDTLEDLKDSTNYALQQHGMPERTIEEVRQFVGNGIRRLLEQAVVEGSPEEIIDEVLHTFQAYYGEHCADKTSAYEGIIPLLKELRGKGILTAVVSNKVDFAVQTLCQDYFPELFDYAVGEKEGIRRKPYPDSVEEILNRYQMKKEDAVFIGDSEVDFATGQNAGIDVIMVAWGFRTEERLKQIGADCIIHRPEELLNYIG